MWYLILFVFWVVVLTTLRIAYQRWRKWRFCQPARYVSEIRSLRYYQNLSPAQLSQLIIEGLKQHAYTLLGDPMIGASREQGFAWKSGKRAVIALWPERPLTTADFNQLAVVESRVKAERVLLFSPFPNAPRPIQISIQVIAGRKFLSWFSVLNALRPPVFGKIAAPSCECGAPMEERVNRAGATLFVCSRYPDCKNMRQPEKQAAAASTSQSRKLG